MHKLVVHENSEGFMLEFFLSMSREERDLLSDKGWKGLSDEDELRVSMIFALLNLKLRTVANSSF